MSSAEQMMDTTLRQAGLDTYYSANLSMAQLVTRQPAFREWVAEQEALDDRIRDAMDAFCCVPHTCDGNPEARASCVACLLIELNKALLPGWRPAG